MTVAAMTMPRAQHGGARLKLHRNSVFGEVSNNATRSENPATTANPATGVDHAVSYLALGGGHLSAPTAGRGGARNRADRVSQALTASHVRRLIEASRHAGDIGLQLNRWITIHWEAAGVPLEAMAAATGRFVDLMSKAIARHGAASAWIWVHENGDHKGGHCHLLAHVPPALVPVIVRLQRGWLLRITGKPYRSRCIKSRPVGGRLGLETGAPDLYAANLDAALAYALKGACPEAATQFWLTKLEGGGRIIGKRCGTSQNIGAKAQARRSTE